MSVELRLTVEGDCECGIPHRIGYQPGCRHGIECDLGVIGDPPLIHRNYETGTNTVENANPVILVSRRWEQFNHLLGQASNVASFYTDSGRKYLRLDADNGSWTYELLNAHWADGEPCVLYVGRWPD